MMERVSIARLGSRGDGVADTPAGVLYVPYTLPGETVEVDQWPGHPDRRHLVKIDNASPDRVAPICPHFGTCGGCALQHLAPARYRAWKRALVGEALAKAKVEAAVDDLVDGHGEGRRRAVFHARRGTHDVLEVGFAALRTHRVVAIDRCPILAPGLEGAIETAWAIAEALAGERKPLDIQVTATDAGLDVDVRGSGPLNAARVGELAAIADRRRLARLTRHGEMVAQRTKPMLRIGRAQLLLPAGAFLQATAAGEATLARLVEAHCAGARTVADLFCGVGPFALRLAERARITAADNDAAAVAALQQAATGAQGLKPVEALARDLFRRPFAPVELKRFDTVVFDPPRQGAEAQARALAASAVATVVAVSCNPATFARDARILIEGGYRLVRVTPVDQFLYSAHVELVALFQRTGDGRRRAENG
ncbi:MAG: class I SAM-dependent RNA methyltransferase [Xanthobacteraceae bacterium]